jgi:hypothetical protein
VEELAEGAEAGGFGIEMLQRPARPGLRVGGQLGAVALPLGDEACEVILARDLHVGLTFRQPAKPCGTVGLLVLLSLLSDAGKLPVEPLLLHLHEVGIAELTDRECERWERVSLIACQVTECAAPFTGSILPCGRSHESLHEGLCGQCLAWRRFIHRLATISAVGCVEAPGELPACRSRNFG